MFGKTHQWNHLLLGSLLGGFWLLIQYPCFPGDSVGKEFACSVGDLFSIPGLGRPPGEGNGCPLQYSGLENSMDCITHGVTKSQTRLSDFHSHCPYSLLVCSDSLFPHDFSLDRSYVLSNTHIYARVSSFLLYSCS